MSERDELLAAIAAEFAQYGVTSIEFVDPDPVAGAARRARLAAEEAEARAHMHYEAGLGIRPPRRGGKVRGVAREDGMEIWHCPHDHAPGVRSCQDLTDAQREEAASCAEAWIRRQQETGRLFAGWRITRDT